MVDNDEDGEVYLFVYEDNEKKAYLICYLSQIIELELTKRAF